jgi:hypothetical protein
MDRLAALKAAMLSIAAPAHPACALGPNPVHSAQEFREALMEFIKCYCGVHAKDGDDCDDLDEEYDRMIQPIDEALYRLRAMVLENHGVDEYDVGLAAKSVDIGDLMIVAGRDCCHYSPGAERCLFGGLMFVPKSREMLELLDRVPKPDENRR